MLTACPSDDELYAHAQGNHPEAGPMQAHLASCPSCTAAIAEALRGLASGGEMEVTREGMRDTPLQLERSVMLKSGAKLGRYSIFELLGKGSMGAVYAAFDPQLNRRIAIKVLRPDGRSRLSEEELRARLLREAQAMARLAHPNVVAVHDAGAIGDQVFVAMDLIDGTTLRRWLEEKPRGWREVLTAYLHAGRGLEAAHLAGLVHRDFKPDNVLVGRDGRILVTDFGLARQSSDANDLALGSPTPPSTPVTSGTLTPLDATPGTPAYMSPEQMQGKGADARSDLFAFCTALYEGVAGVRPYPGRTILELKKLAESGAPQAPIRKIPGWLLHELRRGLSSDPSKRHDSMTSLLRAFESGLAARRLEGALAAAAIAIICLLSIFLFARSRNGATPHNKEAAKLLEQAIEKEHRLDPVGALSQLQQAAKIEPGNPRIDAALTETAMLLGHDQLASEAAARAYARMAELPERERVEFEIARAEVQHASDLAVTLARADAAKEPHDLSRALVVGETQRHEYKYADGLATAQEARKLGPPSPLQELQLEKIESDGLLHVGKLREAGDLAQKQQALARSLGNERELANALNIEGLAERRLANNLPLAKSRFEEALKIFNAIGDPFGATSPTINLATLRADGGDLAGARDQFRKVTETYRQLGAWLSEARVMHNLAIVSRRMGDSAGAIEAEVRASTLLLEGNDKLAAASSLKTLGHLRQDVGDFTNAALSLEQAITLERGLKSALLRDSLVSLAGVRFDQANLPETHRLLAEAAALPRSSDKISLAGEVDLEARVANFEKRHADAEKGSRECVRLAKEANFAPLIAACDGELAEVLLEEGHAPEARQLMNEARAVAAKLNSPMVSDGVVSIDALVTFAEDPDHPERAAEVLKAATRDSGTIAQDRWAVRIALAAFEPDPEKNLNEIARQARVQGFELTAQEAERTYAIIQELRARARH